MKLGRWLIIAAVIVTTAVASAVSVGFFRGAEIVATVWPANALVLALILCGLERRRERAIALLASVAVMVAINLAFDRSPLLSFGFALANGLEIGIAAWCLQRIRMPMTQAADYVGFALGAVFAAPLFSTLLSSVVVIVAGEAGQAELFKFAARWFSADALGMAVIAPFALAVGMRGVRMDLDRRLVRGLLAQALVLAVSIASILPLNLPFSVFIFPAVAVAVFVNRDIGGMLAVAIVAMTLLGGAAAGLGPAARAEQVGADGMLMVQSLLAALVATVHPLSAVLRRLDGYAADAEPRRRQAEQLSASKTRLLTEVSEELRSPLTGVLTVAEILQSGRMGPLSEHQRQLLERMRESGAEIELLTRKMRDAAAIQAGAAKLSADRVNLSALVVGAVTAARFKTRDYNCEFRLGAFDTSVEIFADQSRLRQSLIALLVAAARYAGRPGQVQVSAFENGEGRVRILIEDNGDGVPAQRLRELYTASPDTAGVGIGLGMTRDFIRLQGGDLGLEASSLGGGRVWLDLPTGRLAPAKAA